MDCRRALYAATASLALVAGCDMKSFPSWSSSTPSQTVTHPDEPDADRPKELKPSTLVAYAKLKQNFAEEPDQTDSERVRLREIARQAYLRALNLDPKYIPAHIGLANWHETSGDHAKAIATYEQALKIAPKDRAIWYQLGMCQARHKEWDTAIGNLRTAHDLDPDDRQVTKTLGLCLARAGRYEESVAYLQKAVGPAAAHYLVARMLHHLNEDAASKEQVQIALQISPGMTPARELLDELEGRRKSTTTAAGTE